MISFASDYIAGAHPEVLQHLIDTNTENLPGYGDDFYSVRARDNILKACNITDGDVYFLSGGTQTNRLAVATLLKPWQGVIATTRGHINTHEAGAIEGTGHKVLTVPEKDGKLLPSALREYLNNFYSDDHYEHTVFPGMVYISFPTEYGTLYSLRELTELSEICHKNNMLLYLDGARLGYGICSKNNDVTLSDIARLCDAFYIGGTKMGTLCGEALVFTKKNTPKHFVNQIKHHGALFAKGRLPGIQFDALFTDNLYFRIGEHAINMAEKLRSILRQKGYPFFLETTTNQIFVIIENSLSKNLLQKIDFGFWEKYDKNHTVYRFATSWSTTNSDLEAIEDLFPSLI